MISLSDVDLSRPHMSRVLQRPAAANTAFAFLPDRGPGLLTSGPAFGSLPTFSNRDTGPEGKFAAALRRSWRKMFEHLLQVLIELLCVLVGITGYVAARRSSPNQMF